MQPLGAGEPATVGPYRLLGRLGSGGMGRVCPGRSAGGRTVAVKIVHPHFALDEEFGRLTHTGRLGGVRTGDLTLKRVTKTRIVATSTGAGDNHAGCNPVPHTVELTPVGDDLRYTSDSAAEGDPVSRTSRAD